MINRDGPIKQWKLIRWARAQTGDPRLSGHACRLLQTPAAGYCNEDAICWPSIAQLAKDTRRSPATVKRSLTELTRYRLIYSKQHGRRKPTTRELLLNPAIHSLDEPAMHEPLWHDEPAKEAHPDEPRGSSLRRAPKYSVNEQQRQRQPRTSERAEEKEAHLDELPTPTRSEDRTNGNPRGAGRRRSEPRRLGDALDIEELRRLSQEATP